MGGGRVGGGREGGRGGGGGGERRGARWVGPAKGIDRRGRQEAGPWTLDQHHRGCRRDGHRQQREQCRRASVWVRARVRVRVGRGSGALLSADPSIISGSGHLSVISGSGHLSVWLRPTPSSLARTRLAWTRFAWTRLAWTRLAWTAPLRLTPRVRVPHVSVLQRVILAHVQPRAVPRVPDAVRHVDLLGRWRGRVGARRLFNTRHRVGGVICGRPVA